MHPLLPSLLLCLAPALSAQEAKLPEEPPTASGKAAEPSSSVRPKSTPPDEQGRFRGDPSQLEEYRKGASASIVRDSGAGTEQSPRHYYWKLNRGNKVMRVLFREPSDGKTPALPKEIFMGRQPDPSPADYKATKERAPYQVWFFPEKVDSRSGLFAHAWNIEGGKAGKMRPLFWWGLKYGQELDELSDEELSALYYRGKNSLGFKK